MCKAAQSTVAALMAAIEPTLVNLLTILGAASTPEGQAAIAAYNTALQAVENWKPGTTSQDVIQVISAFTQVFNTLAQSLHLPPEAAALVDTISAGIAVVIGIISGNSPAPATPADATPEEAEAAVHIHGHAVMASTEDEVEKLTHYRPSVWDKARAFAGDHRVAADRYNKVWNDQVASAVQVDPKYSILQVAV